jgi:hypothetical protein
MLSKIRKYKDETIGFETEWEEEFACVVRNKMKYFF